MINSNWIYVGVVINLIGSAGYVITTLQGKTKPNRVTFGLWALAPMIAFAAMMQEGVSFQDGLMTFMAGFAPLMILVASFVNKKSKWKLSTFDMICGALSILGLIAWAITRTGTIAIIFSILADGLAGVPTLRKAWTNPESENYMAFLGGGISALLTLLAITQYDFQHLAFPVYIFIICIVLAVVVKFRLGPRFSKKKLIEEKI